VRFRIRPVETTFYELFTEMANHLVLGADLLAQMLDTGTDKKSIGEQMREAEHQADETTHKIVKRANSTFITPFDREDIYRLAVRLDDVIDYIDAAVDPANLYQLGDLPDGVYAQVDLLCQAAAATAEAMPKLAKPGTLETYWVQANDLENQADQVYRRLLSWLFSGELDTLTVLKLKEIVDQLESAADAFEHVADVVHTIAVKES
jgi:predicted phosphate transport protein (TIGR00153 family)